MNLSSLPTLPALFTRAAVLALALTSLFAVSVASSAAAAPTGASAGAERIGAVCAKRAGQAATPAKRRAIRRRCVREMNEARAARRNPARDTTPPAVSWQAPTAGATVKGSITGSSCLANATDNRGVVKVVMAADGVVLNTELSAPWNCNFDSTKVADGAHTLSATAYDAAGNSRTASVSVNVANAPAPQPEPEPTPSPQPAPSGDTTAPSVSWRTPTAGSTVTGTLGDNSDCLVDAGDAVGVDSVVMKLDGTTLNTERYAPWECDLDSTKVGNGAHTLSATAYDAAGNSRTASITVNVANTTPEPTPSPEPAPTPTPSGSLVIGIDGGYAGWSSTETTYRTQIGATVTRHEWDHQEPVNAQDALVVKAAGTVHTRIHALLGGNQLGDPTHYKEWVVAFVRRYGVGGSFWAAHPELDASRYAITSIELGNEPYFGAMSASLYADTVRPTLEEIKRLGLPVKVIVPTRAYGSDTSWMDTLYSRIPKLNEYVYGFAEHPYWYGHDPAQGTAAGPFLRIETTRRRMNEKGASSKPILITEYGESTASCGGECVTESVQAAHLEAMLKAAITRTEWKIEMVSVFQLLDRGTNSTDRELQFGLIRQNGTLKPSYSMVRNLMQQYRG